MLVNLTCDPKIYAQKCHKSRSFGINLSISQTKLIFVFLFPDPSCSQMNLRRDFDLMLISDWLVMSSNQHQIWNLTDLFLQTEGLWLVSDWLVMSSNQHQIWNLTDLFLQTEGRFEQDRLPSLHPVIFIIFSYMSFFRFLKLKRVKYEIIQIIVQFLMAHNLSAIINGK